ncbi:ABC transporter ATP-binding protein [Caproicibacterium sp. XB2]|jgi:energy-coupling factor transport system ATP-binding protein|uniref:ABC transporter ATP-binding protein n=1 Tax=Caproicibacterium sp. XB2 TaxID=3388458 RepID=UPI000A28DB98|nr:cobalt ABC transporter ATP-binding protein [Ruminococcaceae bacterium CPB6]MDD4807753.1 energy-coupling factor transporter ATPase [Oscillospiraceae bacterium]
MELFSVKDFSFSYPAAPKEALHKVNFSIRSGEYVALCGKSGSGKTTLLSHLKTVLVPHGTRQGTILWKGRPLQQVSLREQSSQIGYVMQNPENQTVTDKVWHELAFGLESLGTDQRTMRLRVAEMASYFGIQSWFYRDVSTLSGGQKQLLNLASIMAMQPEMLILDEPTSQLDPVAASDFLNTVCKLNRELGTTVLISEHRLEEIIPCADRVVVMDNGSIFADDVPRRAGRRIFEDKPELVPSLPAPMQVYYSIGGGQSCPVTVREGRNWLTQELAGKENIVRRLNRPAEPEEDAETVLELKDVWFRYEKDTPDVLKGVSLKLPKGKLSAVVGGNGTGKSTMLKAACGICRPYRGSVLVLQKNIRRWKTERLFHGCLAMLPQDPQCLFLKKTVREDLEEMLSSQKLAKEEGEALLQQVIAECDITELLDAHPYDLSGGEQQKAALAKVLLCRPRILLLDEPTKGIDSGFKAQLAAVFERLKQRQTTILMVSHDIEFCARYADQVSLFFDGSVLTTSPPTQFFSNNSFYTTAANRMSRHEFNNAVTCKDVITLCHKNHL